MCAFRELAFAVEFRMGVLAHMPTCYVPVDSPLVQGGFTAHQKLYYFTPSTVEVLKVNGCSGCNAGLVLPLRFPKPLSGVLPQTVHKCCVYETQETYMDPE